MSLVRAFTQRTKRNDMPPPTPLRAASTRKPGQPLDRSLISSPTLLSTTNVHYRNAVNIPLRNVSESSAISVTSSTSSEESDSSLASKQSRETLTDASSIGSSPTSPQPNHLSEYFKVGQTLRQSTSSGNLHRTSNASSVGAPAIPQRLNSHSKKAHEQLARKRSLQHVTPPTRLSSTHTPPSRMNSTAGSVRSVNSTGQLREQRSSFDMFRTDTEPEHPFGRELEKLSEVVEEFGDVVRTAEMEEDMALMEKKGLVRFCVDDYLAEIRPLILELFSMAQQPRHIAVNATWI